MGVDASTGRARREEDDVVEDSVLSGLRRRTSQTSLQPGQTQRGQRDGNIEETEELHQSIAEALERGETECEEDSLGGG